MTHFSPNPDVTFLVPLFNSEGTVVETLQSIVDQNSPLRFQIVVIDDGSTDRSRGRVEQWLRNTALPPDRQVEIHHQENRGEAAAVNAGLSHAKAEWVAWVESDVRLDSNWLAGLMAELEKEDEVGAGGILLPAEDDSALSLILGYEIANKIASNDSYPRHITSANALYKAHVFRELGPCTEQLGESSFDSEYNQRILRRGWKLKLGRQSRAWHHFKSSGWDCLRRTFWYGYRRPYVEAQVLYPSDRWIGVLVLLSALFLPALLCFPIAPVPALLAAAVILLPHLAYGVFLYRRFGYRPLILSGFVFLLRNMIFFYAYLLGWASFFGSRRKRKP